MLKLNLLRSADKDVVNRWEDMENKDAVAEQEDGGVECDHEEFFDTENGDFLGPGKSNGEVGGPDKVDGEVDEGKTLQPPLLCTHSPGTTPGFVLILIQHPTPRIALFVRSLVRW